MASEGPVSPDTELSNGPGAVRRARPPFYKDPLSILGWGIALASIVAYWYFFVRKPVPKPGQQIAQLTAVEGQVRVRPQAKEAWDDARLQDQLHVGDVLQTEARSAAEILFNSGNVVSVRPQSVVYIGGSAEASTAAWRVQSGRVSFSTGGEETEIVTPTLKTRAVQDAAGNIDVRETGETDVKIFRGRAEVETTRGQRVSLGANQVVQVDAAGRAGAPLELPPPPTLVAPAPRARLPFVAPPEATATLAWNAVKGGVTYRLAMDFNVTQANLLLSAALDEPGITTTSHDLAGLRVGRYFWRVFAVNENGLEGAPSRVSYFAVVDADVPKPAATPDPGKAPSLVLQAVEEVAPGILHLGGRTDPGAAVTVDGTPVDVMPDGSFSEYVRRAATGGLLVRATAPSGRFTEQMRAARER